MGFVDFRLFVIRFERIFDFVDFVDKIEHKGIDFTLCRAVEARQGLHGFQVRQPLIDEHGVQKRLIKSGLVLFCDDQDLIFGSGKTAGQFALANAVHPGFCVMHARHVRIRNTAGKCHQCFEVRVSFFGDGFVKSPFVAHRVEA